MNKRIEGIITEKKPYSGNSSHAPTGDIYIDRDKFACWDKVLFDKYSVGEKVGIDYTEKENEYNGKTYINKSVVSIDGEDNKSVVDETDLRYSEQEKTELEKMNVPTNDLKKPLEGIPFKSEPFKVSGFTYKIVGTLELVR